MADVEDRLFAILFSLVVGLLCSIVLYYKVKGISGIIVAYIELSRNTPLLVQLYFLYYGFTKIGLHMSEMTCAIVGMTFLGGVIWLRRSVVESKP